MNYPSYYTPNPPPRSDDKMLWIGLGVGGGILFLIVGAIVALVIVAQMGKGKQGDGAVASSDAEDSGSGSILGSSFFSGSSGSGESPESGAGPVASAPKRPDLKYKWQAGESYTWFVKVESDSVVGKREYSVSSSFFPRDLTSEFVAQEPERSTGTAFAISKNGYLLTCAHVVDHGTKIEAEIDGKRYPVEVVAADGHLDIALIKIANQNLKPMMLADKNDIELAQEVRSVGFPLSSVLGSSAKITRGTIAGNVEIDGRSLYQVDASINPGNSGGPVVNLSGHVIGMASEKMYGQEITNVGFCVPAHELRTWLSQHNMNVPIGKKGADLDGPALAKNAIPSVAMIHVESEMGGAAGGKLFSFRELMSVDFDVRDPKARLEYLFDGGLEKGGSGVVDSTGKFGETNDLNQLPFLLGPPVFLSIIPLPQKWQNSWSTERSTQISFAERSESVDPIQQLLYRRLGRLGIEREPERVVSMEAVEAHRYRITSIEGNLIGIEDNWIVRTLDSPPSLACSGICEYTFDADLGLITKGTADCEFTTKRGDDLVTSPFRLELSLLSDATGRTSSASGTPGGLAGSQSPSSSSGSSGGSSRQSKPTTTAILDKAFTELDNPATDSVTRQKAIASIASHRVELEHRDIVVSKLSAQLENNQDPMLVAKAIAALAEWDNGSCCSKIREFLSAGRSPMVMQAAVAYAGEMHDEESVPALVENFPQGAIRPEIMKALIEIGSAAEPEVLKLLNHPDPILYGDVCKVLQEIGTTKCFEPLRKLAAQKHPAAEEAKKTLQILGADAKPAADDDENPFEVKKKK